MEDGEIKEGGGEGGGERGRNDGPPRWQIAFNLKTIQERS